MVAQDVVGGLVHRIRRFSIDRATASIVLVAERVDLVVGRAWPCGVTPRALSLSFDIQTYPCLREKKRPNDPQVRGHPITRLVHEARKNWHRVGTIVQRFS